MTLGWTPGPIFIGSRRRGAEASPGTRRGMKKPTKKMAKSPTPAAAGGNTWNIQEKALKEMERGLQSLHKQSWSDALTHFQAIIDGYPQEKELQDRAQMYARVCKTHQSDGGSQRAKPEDLFYLG